jgi:hypothetical protein
LLCSFSQGVARGDIYHGQYKKSDNDGNKYQIKHKNPFLLSGSMSGDILRELIIVAYLDDLRELLLFNDVILHKIESHPAFDGQNCDRHQEQNNEPKRYG